MACGSHERDLCHLPREGVTPSSYTSQHQGPLPTLLHPPPHTHTPLLSSYTAICAALRALAAFTTRSRLWASRVGSSWGGDVQKKKRTTFRCSLINQKFCYILVIARFLSNLYNLVRL
jgi:hypothetical protein